MALKYPPLLFWMQKYKPSHMWWVLASSLSSLPQSGPSFPPFLHCLCSASFGFYRQWFLFRVELCPVRSFAQLPLIVHGAQTDLAPSRLPSSYRCAISSCCSQWACSLPHEHLLFVLGCSGLMSPWLPLLLLIGTGTMQDLGLLTCSYLFMFGALWRELAA